MAIYLERWIPIRLIVKSFVQWTYRYWIDDRNNDTNNHRYTEYSEQTGKVRHIHIAINVYAFEQNKLYLPSQKISKQNVITAKNTFRFFNNKWRKKNFNGARCLNRLLITKFMFYEIVLFLKRKNDKHLMRIAMSNKNPEVS